MKLITIISPSVLVFLLLVNFVIPLHSGSLHDLNNEHNRYYFNPPCENPEPPSSPPFVYDWDSNTIPDRAAPNWENYVRINSGCVHSPLSASGLENPHEKYCRENPYISNFRYNKLGLGQYAKIALRSSVPVMELIRNNDSINAGNYFEYPWGSVADVDSSDRAFLERYLSEYLSADYYTEAILDSIDNRYLDDLGRKEFYFETQLKDTRFRFSGWYGKLIHIFVFTDYDSKDSFLVKAQSYFNLPSINKTEISYSEENIMNYRYLDFYYFYNSSENDFKLAGYPHLLCSIDPDSIDISFDNAILDLTIYAEEE